MSTFAPMDHNPVSLEEVLKATEGISQNFPNFPIADESSQVEQISLNEKKSAAIELLALGKSYTIVAKTLGVDRRTVFNWRKEESFGSELRRRHRELWGDASERLKMLADPSLEVMAEHLNDRYDRARFRAAATILKLVKLTDKEPE